MRSAWDVLTFYALNHQQLNIRLYKENIRPHAYEHIVNHLEQVVQLITIGFFTFSKKKVFLLPIPKPHKQMQN